MKFLFLGLLSFSSVIGNLIPRSGNAPPDGAILVDQSGSAKGSYPTVQKGVDALSKSSKTAQTLFIYAGTYKEQVYIPKLASSLIVQGQTSDSSSYHSNQVTITQSRSLARSSSDDEYVSLPYLMISHPAKLTRTRTATVRNWSENTKFYNLNIENTFGHTNTDGQNLALSAHSGNQGYYACQLRGYQDTVLANTGAQLYSKCMISGAIDFIFGETATAWFEKIDIRTIAAGSITASGRDSPSNPSIYVLNNCNIAAQGASAGSTYLGRPWKDYARVVFQNTQMSDVVNAAGWQIWQKGDEHTDHCDFEEYGNSGAGSAKGGRATFSKQAGSAVGIGSVLGGSYKSQFYVDASYL